MNFRQSLVLGGVLAFTLLALAVFLFQDSAPASHPRVVVSLASARQLSNAPEIALLKPIFQAPETGLGEISPISAAPADQVLTTPSAQQPNVQPIPTAAPAALLPVAFFDADSVVRFSPEQQSAMATLRQQFVAELGPNPQSQDPNYNQRWQKARSVADQRFKAQFGSELFSWLQKEAIMEASGSPQAAISR